MRILVATDAFPPNCGGSGWSTWELARGLRSRGHVVTIVQPRPGTPSGPRVREYDAFAVTEFGAPAPNLPFLRHHFKTVRLIGPLAEFLARKIDQDEIDLVHAQHVLTGPPAVRAARATRRPVVCTVRDYWPVCYWSDLIIDRHDLTLCPACSVANMSRCVRPRAERTWPLALPMIPYMRASLTRKRRALAGASAVIAVSSTIATDLRARAPELARTRVETIPNPIGLESTRAAATSTPPLDAPYAVYVGKLAPNKGTVWLTDVAREARLPWPLVVVGDGPDRSRIEADARRARLDLRVLGWLPRDEALRWMAHATLVVFPSHGPESLSRVLLEAGALGRPVAAMDTGGTRDIIRHGHTGLLSVTPDALGRDVARLVGDAPLRRALGDALRDHVQATFEAARVVDRVEALYRELLTGDGRG